MKALYQRFELHSSLGLAIVLWLMHIGAIFCVCFVSFSWWFRVVLIFWALINLIYVLHCSIGVTVEFGLKGNGIWYVKKNSGDLVLATLSPPLFVSNYLIILNFIACEKRLKFSLPIARDAIAPEDFRRLKVLLKTMR